MDSLTVEPFTWYDESNWDPHPLAPEDGLFFMPNCQTHEDQYNGEINPTVMEHSERLKQELMQCEYLEYLDLKIPSNTLELMRICNNLIPMLLTVPYINQMEIGNHISINNVRGVDNHDVQKQVDLIVSALELTRGIPWTKSSRVMVYISSHIPLTVDQVQPLIDFENPYSYSVSIKYVYDSYDDLDVPLLVRGPPDPNLGGIREVELYDPLALEWKK